MLPETAFSGVVFLSVCHAALSPVIRMRLAKDLSGALTVCKTGVACHSRGYINDDSQTVAQLVNAQKPIHILANPADHDSFVGRS